MTGFFLYPFADVTVRETFCDLDFPCRYILLVNVVKPSFKSYIAYSVTRLLLQDII